MKNTLSYREAKKMTRRETKILLAFSYKIIKNHFAGYYILKYFSVVQVLLWTLNPVINVKFHLR